MNRLEHLLTIAAEECAEIAQRISKAQRFGLGEIQPGQGYDNAERINNEFNDLIALLRMIEEETGRDLTEIFGSEIRAKQRKVEEFLLLSAEQRTLS